jgi:transcriptional regulator with XRE-family HTH domain
MEIASFTDYKKLLMQLIKLDQTPGSKARLARAIGCQPAYLSRVLADRADLSADQVAKAAGHFHLSESETEYWVYLLLENRSLEAGAKFVFKKRLSIIRQKLNQLQSKLETSYEKIPHELESIYYSSWIIPSMHMAIQLPQLQKSAAFASALGVREEEAKNAIAKLVEMGLATHKNGKIVPTKKSLHLGVDSGWIDRYHANWRIKTLERISRGDVSGLHYSSAISCSIADLEKIRGLFVSTINRVREIVKNSEDETVAHYAVDCFDLRS